MVTHLYVTLGSEIVDLHRTNLNREMISARALDHTIRHQLLAVLCSSLGKCGANGKLQKKKLLNIRPGMVY